jgi:hypothetical protein
MAQYNLKEQVFCGDRRQYYSYDEELYTETFPLEWAETHHPGTGPKECLICQTFGFWNGVFIGYCVNCAIYSYQGQRGSGFVEKGIEYKVGCNIPSIFETYLKGIKMDDIGDKDFIDTAKVYETEEDKDYFEYLESIDRHYDEECKCCCSYFGSHYIDGYESY